MANKQLIGTYPSGYALLTKWAGAVIQATALIEGPGFSAAALATVTNEGTVTASAGPVGASKVRGGIGSNGLNLMAGGLVTNLATINAGGGGAGGYDATGGAGGGGVVLAALGSVTNKGVIAGGAGGAPGAKGTLGGAGGAGVSFKSGGDLVNGGSIVGGTGTVGGHGGSGVALAGGGTVTNTTGSIVGGSGGAGSDGGTGVALVAGGSVDNTNGEIAGGASSPSGGEGGVGITAQLTATVTNSSTIIGGDGTAAPDQVDDGGDAISFAAGGTVTNSGLIAGGASVYFRLGGAGVLMSSGAVDNTSGTISGGVGDNALADYQNGGNGGVGVEISGSGTVTNGRLIQGGSGGDGGNVPFGAYFPPQSGFGGEGGSGVFLENGGTLINSGSIVGGAAGAGGFAYGIGYIQGGDAGFGVVLYGSGTVNNGGLVEGGSGGATGFAGDAIQMRTGQVLNAGTILGGSGSSPGSGVEMGAVEVVIAGTILNSGVIEGGVSTLGDADGIGIDVSYGKTVMNGAPGKTAALIEGGLGVRAYYGVETVTNFGTINGLGQSGVGVVFERYASGSVINYGTIGCEGTSADHSYSVKFDSTSDALIAESGAVFVGEIAGGGGTLAFAGGAGTITGLGGAGAFTGSDTGSFVGFGSYVIGEGGNWTLAEASALSLSQSLTISAAATLAIGAGATATLQGAVTNDGTVAIDGGALVFGSGGLKLNAPGQWVLSDSAASSIAGLASADTLANVNATISGAGGIGGGLMTLVNDAGGVIDADDTLALTLNTGADKITNAGLIEVTGSGGLTIVSALANKGELLAEGGTLTCDGVVSGKGPVEIGTAGTLVFAAGFNAGVSFIGTSGALVFARSQSFTATITGFSATGGTSLDLRDIAFVSAGEATFNGTAKGGVLTVTDGTHTARLTLAGDYLASTFTCSSDGDGGVLITDPPASAPALAQALGAFAPALTVSASHDPATSAVNAATMLTRPALYHA